MKASEILTQLFLHWLKVKYVIVLGDVKYMYILLSHALYKLEAFLKLNTTCKLNLKKSEYRHMILEILEILKNCAISQLTSFRKL